MLKSRVMKHVVFLLTITSLVFCGLSFNAFAQDVDNTKQEEVKKGKRLAKGKSKAKKAKFKKSKAKNKTNNKMKAQKAQGTQKQKEMEENAVTPEITDSMENDLITE